MYNKTIIRFGFCDIRNNQGLGKCYQPQPAASADNIYLDLDYSGYHKNLIQYLFIITFAEGGVIVSVIRQVMRNFYIDVFRPIWSYFGF